MFKLLLSLYLVTAFCWGRSRARVFEPDPSYDANCTTMGEEEVEASALDRIIRRMQQSGRLERIYSFFRASLKDPDSRLSKLMGNAAIDPVTWDDESDTFDFTRGPDQSLKSFYLKFLIRAVGSGRTVVSYLWNYGFIPKVLNLSKRETDKFNGAIQPCALTNAIREFQLFNQIEPADGKLTKQTIKKMAEDRCGNHDAKCTTPRCLTDDRYNNRGRKLRRRRYAVRRKKWKMSKKGNLNIAYYYENMYNPNSTETTNKTGHDATMVPEVVKREIEKGLFEWTKYSGINFIEVSDAKKAAVKIRFGPAEHGEKNPSTYFDGPYGVLAHMYYPRKGEMHFDEAENFTASNDKPGINLHFVTAHEMGHGLGMEHSNVPRALMAPIYIGYRDQMLREDEIKAVRHLYGIGNGFVAPLDGETIVAPEGLATGIKKGDTVVVREDGAEGGKLVKGGEKEEEEGVSKADKCAKGSQVTFQQTKDLGHCIEGFSAGFQDPTEDHIYLFYNENHYLRLESGHQNMKFPRVSEPESSYSEMLVSKKFPGLEGPYDAAVTDNALQVTYFFVDGTVTTWDWSTDAVGDLDREPIENTMFSGIPDSDEINAVAKYHDQFIFFCGDEYYIFTADEGVSGPYDASMEEEMIASAFNSFYNGYIYTTTDSFLENSVYNLMSAKKLTAGAADAASFQETVMQSYSNIDMTDDTMFGWPCGLGFCGAELEDIRPVAREEE